MNRQTLAVGWLALLSGAFLVAPGYVHGATTLIFPRLGFEEGTFTGVAFVNPSGTPARITLTALSPAGSPLTGPEGFRNPAVVEVPAFQQRARVLADLFGTLPPADRFGWIRADSDVDSVTGFFLFLDGALTFWDGADLPVAGRKIVFPRIRLGDGYSTEINLINPSDVEAQITARLFQAETGQFRDSVRPVSVKAQGVARVSLVDDFGVDSAADGSYLQVVSSAPVAGFEIVRLQGKDIVGLNARSAGEGFQVLYFPQMAVLGPWTTRLGLINLSDEAVLANVFAHQADGSLYSGGALQGANPATVQIPPQGAVFRDVAEIFQFSGDTTVDGWLKVQTSRPVLSGFVTYGVPSSGSEAAVAQQPAALTRALFGHIAVGRGLDPFTGLALLNPGQISNSVRVMAFNRDTGQPYGIFDGVLRPGERLSKLITELIPVLEFEDFVGGGFIWVKSEHPLYMTSLFGTPRVLANIPPQPAPPAFGPGDGAPAVSIKPAIAIVQPGRTQQFNLTGPSGSRTWQVNGQTGGTAVTGQISPAGVYTAPANSPEALPVTISALVDADAGQLKAGASVDVLTKEVLFQGSGVVQSVAFLRGLQTLYSAELTAGAAGSGGSDFQTGADSVIFVSAPGPRRQLASLPGEDIVKMIEYRAGNGKDFLLLCSRTSGKVLRMDPATGAYIEVAGGFSEPNSIAIDPLTGNLLVADKFSVRSVERTQLESGLAPTLRARFRNWTGAPPLQIGDVQDARGVSVDACNGRIYVSQATGGLVAVDRLTGDQVPVFSGSEAPGQLLGLYRKEVPCPDAFQLLLADRADGRVRLVGPALGLATEWVNSNQARTWDISYLPIGSDVGSGATQTSGILLSESAGLYGDANQVSLVNLPNLYVDQQINTPQDVRLGYVTDPFGDTFGQGGPDIWFVYGGTYETELSAGLFLAEPIEASELVGFVEVDLDRNPETGVTSLIDQNTPYASNLGVEYRVDLSTFEPDPESTPEFAFGSADLVDAATGETVASAFCYFPAGSGALFINVSWPETVSTSGQVNFGVLLGTRQGGYSDAAPNGGFLTTDIVVPE